MKTDTKELSAQIREFNRWRRGDETLQQPQPAEIGLMLDAAAKRLEKLERQLEQERQDRKQADLDTIRALGERNDARAELAAERALADRLASALTDSAMWYAPPAYEAYKEARHE
jgi:hypothetical protein